VTEESLAGFSGAEVPQFDAVVTGAGDESVVVRGEGEA